MSGWVSVYDDLPPMNVYVLGFGEIGISIAKRSPAGSMVKGRSGPNWSWIRVGGICRKPMTFITHWMPLPETPVRQS